MLWRLIYIQLCIKTCDSYYAANWKLTPKKQKQTQRQRQTRLYLSLLSISPAPDQSFSQLLLRNLPTPTTRYKRPEHNIKLCNKIFKKILCQKKDTESVLHVQCCKKEETTVKTPIIITGEKHPCVDLLKNSLGSISRETRFNNPQHPVDETIFLQGTESLVHLRKLPLSEVFSSQLISLSPEIVFGHGHFWNKQLTREVRQWFSRAS